MRQVTISIETTGAEFSAEHRIIEIGCVELLDGQFSGNYYHQYINPSRPIEDLGIKKHGITNDFLIDKPYFKDIAEELLDFLDNDQLVTYKADFVIDFLNHELAMLDNNFPNKIHNKVIDILKVGNQRHPEQDNSFESLCDRYYVGTSQTDFSGALLTAEIIADLLLALSDQSTKNITSDLSRYQAGDNLIVVDTFSDFDKAIDGISKSALCRGVSNHEYPLLPSLFRHTDVESADRRENNLMWVFKTHAKAHLDAPPQTDIEWLAIAQHHGLPTRLLDWSLSPLIACFFAVKSLSSDDGAVYIYDIGNFTKEEDIDLSNLSDIVAFFPSHATKRVTAQSGMFTIHPTKCMKLESNIIKKILIPASRKKKFLEKLVKYGVHHATIFPDLDGLSSYIKHQNNYV